MFPDDGFWNFGSPTGSPGLAVKRSAGKESQLFGLQRPKLGSKALLR